MAAIPLTQHHITMASRIQPLVQFFRAFSRPQLYSRCTLSVLPRRPISLPSLPNRRLLSSSPQRTFSTTPTPSYAAGRRRGPKVRRDPRVRKIRFHLAHPITPRPLRFSRNRALRHWTIHRAWQLYRRKLNEAREGELMRCVDV